MLVRMQCDNTLWIYSSENEKERVEKGTVCSDRCAVIYSKF